MTGTDRDATVDDVKTRGFVVALVLVAASCGSLTAEAKAPLVPADGALPAAGICEPQRGHVATVTLTMYTPEPRCTDVRGGQELRLVDATDKRVTVHWRPWASVTLRPGHSVTFADSFSHYLAKGMHVVMVQGAPTAELVYGHMKQPAIPVAG